MIATRVAVRERQQDYITRSHAVTKEAVAAWDVTTPLEQLHRHAWAGALTAPAARANP